MVAGGDLIANERGCVKTVGSRAPLRVNATLVAHEILEALVAKNNRAALVESSFCSVQVP